MSHKNKYAAEAKAARENRIRHHQCRRKVRFPTKDAALQENSGQQAYLCRFCGGWHLSGALNRTLYYLRTRRYPCVRLA